MSTLHEQLLAKLDDLSGWSIGDDGMAGPVNFARDYRQATSALRAVVERHKPSPCCAGHFTCSACGSGRTWPTGCPDTMAIASALGVEVDGD